MRHQVTLSPRFAVVQGVKANGDPKVRPIDDLTRSGCNAATETTEKLSYESLDALLAVLRRMEKKLGSGLELWKVSSMRNSIPEPVNSFLACIRRPTSIRPSEGYLCILNTGSMHTWCSSTMAKQSQQDT